MLLSSISFCVLDDNDITNSNFAKGTYPLLMTVVVLSHLSFPMVRWGTIFKIAQMKYLLILVLNISNRIKKKQLTQTGSSKLLINTIEISFRRYSLQWQTDLLLFYFDKIVLIKIMLCLLATRQFNSDAMFEPK